jgi:hypothetical protein
MARGVPTADGTAPLNNQLMAAGGEPLPVWPTPRGTLRGSSLAPLYPGAPDAALRDPQLHACLALIDAIRIGRARERGLARKILKETLGLDRTPRSD